MLSFVATITIAPITTHYVVATDHASRVTVNSSTVSGRAAHKRDPSGVQRSRATHRQPQEIRVLTLSGSCLHCPSIKKLSSEHLKSSRRFSSRDYRNLNAFAAQNSTLFRPPSVASPISLIPSGKRRRRLAYEQWIFSSNSCKCGRIAALSSSFVSN
jgi:hypothetical protein